MIFEIKQKHKYTHTTKHTQIINTYWRQMRISWDTPLLRAGWHLNLIEWTVNLNERTHRTESEKYQVNLQWIWHIEKDRESRPGISLLLSMVNPLKYHWYSPICPSVDSSNITVIQQISEPSRTRTVGILIISSLSSSSLSLSCGISFIIYPLFFTYNFSSSFPHSWTRWN